MAKLGKCPECPQNSREVLLIGGKCNYHFANPGAKVERSEKEVKIPGVKSDKVEMDAWFTQRLKEQPVNSENDPTRKIYIPHPLPERTSVCHIVPKKQVPSVKSHPLNRWFGNADEHDFYDKHFYDEAANMPVAAKCIQRFSVFMHLVPPSEMQHVPEWLVKGAEILLKANSRGMDSRKKVVKTKPRTR